MKTFLKKHWAVLFWIATVVFDSSYGLSEALFDNPVYQSIFKIIGALILAAKWSPNINKQNK
jgi:hypothetical protein